MNSFKIRFVDVLRYFILGGVEILLYSCLIDKSVISELVTNDGALPTTIVVALLCIGLYLIGFVTQSIIQLFFNGDFLGSGLGEMAQYIRFYPRTLLNRRGYPNWLYWSDKPRRVLDIYRDVLETGEGSETKTEFLYSNQLFQGVAFAIFVTVTYGYLQSFSCLGEVYRWLIILALLTLLWYLHRRCGETKYVVIPVWCGYTIAPLYVLFLEIAHNCSVSTGVSVFAAFTISLWLAQALARKQIRRIDILANFSKESSAKFNETLAKVGVPKVYILTRTNTSSFIDEELGSISTQTYPNIKVIVLADKSLQAKPDELSKLRSIIEGFQNGKTPEGKECLKMNIQLYESSNVGPAALSYEIRQIFLDYANSDDIAITLDSDDKLYSPFVVDQIVTKLFRTESNVCLIRFEIFGEKNLNYSKNHHNELVKDLCYDIPLSDVGTPRSESENTGGKQERLCPIRPEDLLKEQKLYRISTIGWTKCYKKGVLKKYQYLLKPYVKEFATKQKYEDFPDIMALMDRDTRICSVARNSVLFRKSANSVTTAVTSDNYINQIPYFLFIAKALTKDCKGEINKESKYSLIEGGDLVIKDRLIPYKFVQYLNVVYKKTKKSPPDSILNKEEFTCDKFYNAFVREVFEITIPENGVVNKDDYSTLEAFHSHVEDIIKGEDYDILGADEFPKSKDFDGQLDITKDSTWEDICNAYKLTKIKKDFLSDNTDKNE